LNYLERRNGVILRYFSEFGYLPGVLRKSSRSLSHLLMSSCSFMVMLYVCYRCGEMQLKKNFRTDFHKILREGWQ